MKYLSVITVFCIVFNISANSNELDPLENYASENNYHFDGLYETKNPKEFMFNMSLRCAGFWSSLNDFPKLIIEFYKMYRFSPISAVATRGSSAALAQPF